MRTLVLIATVCLAAATAGAYNVGRYASEALEIMQGGDIEKGVEAMKKAASVNDLAAQFFMGVCYEKGIGADADPAAAFAMYRRAAERGLPPAMLELARCYREGIGVDKNEARAREWQVRYERKHDGSSLPDIASMGTRPRKPATAASKPAATQPKQQSQRRTTPARTQKPAAPATQPDPAPASAPILSDVDKAIPTVRTVNENLFALIIANENYQDVAPVPNALNDGEIFARYCTSTLGMPSSNVHLVKDATLNNIKREVNLMKQIAAAYGGKASFVVYYAGHGIPDESSRESFILPVDGFGSDLTTCYSLNDLYKTFGEMPSAKTVILLDACFSGAVRGEGMLAMARGVAIKAKSGAPAGNMVVISSAQGDETAYPYKEQNHGLFTYYLLKKLKDSKGAVTLGELVSYVKDNVVKRSLVVNGKSQTPTASPSAAATNWQSWKLN